MREGLSPATRRRYPLTMICAVFRVSRSTVYRTMVPAGSAPPAVAKRGPKTRWSDAEVIAAIRAVLAATPFHGEGYRKVRARLAHRGLAIGGKRVLRLMRVHHRLAPRRLGPPNGDPAHAGTITTTRPDEMWGTDATRFATEAEWKASESPAVGAVQRVPRRPLRRVPRRRLQRSGSHYLSPTT